MDIERLKHLAGITEGERVGSADLRDTDHLLRALLHDISKVADIASGDIERTLRGLLDKYTHERGKKYIKWE